MRRAAQLVVLTALAIAAGAGCGAVEDKVVVRIVDPDGVVAPREVTVGYVNDRLDRMPPQMIPDAGGDEGKREFIDEIIRKELLVILAHRLGLQNDPQLEELRGLFETDRAWQLYQERAIYDPAEPTDADVAEYNVLRGTTFELQQLTLSNKEEAGAALQRVTGGGEDFGAVATELSTAPSAPDGGVMPSLLWPDIHPVVGYAIAGLQTGDISELTNVGGVYHIYKILNRIEPVDPPPLDAHRMAALMVECRTVRRSVRQYELNAEMLDEANLRYSDDAMALASARLGDQAAEIIPENIMELDFEARMAIAGIPLVPEFSDEEAAMHFLTYAVGGTDHTWTLGDLRDLLAGTPGIEGPKAGDADVLKTFLWRMISKEIVENEIERGRYRESPEVKEYLVQRTEEYVVDVAYNAEVTDKIIAPTGAEIREYFQSHRDDYMRPQRVDVRQIIVDTEAEANALRQRLMTGNQDFVELVRSHSVDGWSKSRDGLVPDYFQGERRLSYLQGVAFDLEIGEISQPVRAPGGYALIKVIAKDPAYHLDFKDVGDKVKETLFSVRREERLSELLDELMASVTIEWLDDNLIHVKDTAEAKKEKYSQGGVATS